MLNKKVLFSHWDGFKWLQQALCEKHQNKFKTYTRGHLHVTCVGSIFPYHSGTVCPNELSRKCLAHQMY